MTHFTDPMMARRTKTSARKLYLKLGRIDEQRMIDRLVDEQFNLQHYINRLVSYSRVEYEVLAHVPCVRVQVLTPEAAIVAADKFGFQRQVIEGLYNALMREVGGRKFL